MSPECHLMHTFHNSLSLSQGWMDHVHQCILARASRWLLPVIPHHSPVHCSWVGHGGVGQGQAGAPGSECLRLGPLVPQDEGLWLHVYGLRPAEGQRHRPLLDLHLLHHPHHCPGLHSVREADEGRKEGEKEEWKGGENWGGEERWSKRTWERRQSENGLMGGRWEDVLYGEDWFTKELQFTVTDLYGSLLSVRSSDVSPGREELC